MITAWEIYWVLRLDDIGFFFGVVAVFCILIGAIGTIAWRVASAFGTDDEEAKVFANAVSIAPLILVIGVLSGVVNTFIPSSKDAAAMIVLPAITSDSAIEAIEPEAREILELAKDALRGIAPQKDASAKDGDKVNPES